MTGWFEGYVNANGIRIHYWRTGGADGGKPPVVLAHGFSDNGRCWQRVARALEARYDVIMPDARGHGLSEAPATGYDYGTLAADLAAFCTTLRLSRSVIGGHSMGGSTVCAAAALYPDLWRAVVLVDPGWTDARGEQVTNTMDKARARRLMTRAQLLLLLDERHPNWVMDDRDPWVEARMQLSEAALQLGAQPSGNWREQTVAIACPALLVVADPAPPGSAPDRPLDGIVTPQMAAEAQQLNPRISVAHIAHAGHSIHYDQFDAFVATVTAFLRSLA